MLPPAPALFSTITAWPRFSLSFCAMIRAAVSVPPPAAKPTVNVTGRLGKLCPPTAPATINIAAASTVRNVDFIRSSCRCLLPVRVQPGADAMPYRTCPSLAQVCCGIRPGTRRASPYSTRDMDFSRHYDLLVIGGGNAALCAAITARGHGLDVLIVEAAPIHFRGGNSRHTRNIRTMHAGPLEALTETYSEEEYWQDLFKVTGGVTDEKLARLTIRHTESHIPWMKRYGVRFQPPLGGTLQLARTNAFFLGGGKALLNAYYAVAEHL